MWSRPCGSIPTISFQELAGSRFLIRSSAFNRSSSVANVSGCQRRWMLRRLLAGPFVKTRLYINRIQAREHIGDTRHELF